MSIKSLIVFQLIAGVILFSLSCNKKNTSCLKEGYTYVNSSAFCWYSPALDSIPLGASFTLEAALPKTFIDENRFLLQTNKSGYVRGNLGVGMILPIFQGFADSFELTPQIGKVIKDTANFTEGQLKGFRTIEWDRSAADSFRMKISIRPLTKGVFALSLKRQGSKDEDCALYKYFLKVGSDQHLHYWAEFNNGIITDDVSNYGYCFKVY